MDAVLKQEKRIATKSRKKITKRILVGFTDEEYAELLYAAYSSGVYKVSSYIVDRLKRCGAI